MAGQMSHSWRQAPGGAASGGWAVPSVSSVVLRLWLRRLAGLCYRRLFTGVVARSMTWGIGGIGSWCTNRP